MIYNIFKEVKEIKDSQEETEVVRLEPYGVAKFIDKLKDKDKMKIVKDERYDLSIYDSRKHISFYCDTVIIKDYKAGSEFIITADSGTLRINNKQIDTYSSIKTINAGIIYLGEYRSCHCGKLSLSIITGNSEEFIYEIKYLRCCCEYLIKIHNITLNTEMELVVEEESCERRKIIEEDYVDLRIEEWVNEEFNIFDNWLDSEYVTCETIEVKETLAAVILLCFAIIVLAPIVGFLLAF